MTSNPDEPFPPYAENAEAERDARSFAKALEDNRELAEMDDLDCNPPGLYSLELASDRIDSIKAETYLNSLVRLVINAAPEVSIIEYELESNLQYGEGAKFLRLLDANGKEVELGASLPHTRMQDHLVSEQALSDDFVNLLRRVENGSFLGLGVLDLDDFTPPSSYDRVMNAKAHMAKIAEVHKILSAQQAFAAAAVAALVVDTFLRNAVSIRFCSAADGKTVVGEILTDKLYVNPALGRSGEAGGIEWGFLDTAIDHDIDYSPIFGAMIQMDLLRNWNPGDELPRELEF